MLFFFVVASSLLAGTIGVWKAFVFAFVVFAPNGALAFGPALEISCLRFSSEDLPTHWRDKCILAISFRLQCPFAS